MQTNQLLILGLVILADIFMASKLFLGILKEESINEN